MSWHARRALPRLLRRLAWVPPVRNAFHSLWLEHGLCLHLLEDRMRLETTPLHSLFPGAESVAVTIDVLPDGAWRTRLDDLVYLIKIARITQPARVLELGSYRGVTAKYLARNIAPAGVVVAVDHDPDHGVAYRESELPIERRVGEIGPELFRDDPPGGYDLIFVDADHTYEDARRDSELALRLVAPDGHVVWHDYLNFGYFSRICEVPELLGELARDRRIVHVAGSTLAIHSPAWDRPIGEPSRVATRDAGRA